MIIKAYAQNILETFEMENYISIITLIDEKNKLKVDIKKKWIHHNMIVLS